MAMQTANLETLVPGLAETRAKEQGNRALAFSGITRTLCGVEIVALRPEVRLRLQLLRNAFAAGRPDIEPLEGDVFVFLWAMSPHFGQTAIPTFRQWALRRRVRKMALHAAVVAINDYVASQLQDSPGSSTGADGADNSAYVHWMAAEAGFWINVHGGFTLETYARTPYLILQQLFRAWQINHPVVRRTSNGGIEVEEPLFLNGSDALVANWHRSHREAIAEAIRNQRERLN